VHIGAFDVEVQHVAHARLVGCSAGGVGLALEALGAAAEHDPPGGHLYQGV